MKALTVIGTTKTGKTTTIENIIKELKRRKYSVGSVKEIHNEKFAIDSEGTNTYRHRAAGAEVVTARGHYETDIMYQQKLSIEEILGFYNQDYVIMEGVEDYNVPVILCAEKTEDLEKHEKKDYFERVFAVSGVISNTAGVFKDLPIINPKTSSIELVDLINEKVFEILPDFPAECCSLCGYDCRTLSARILKGLSKRSDCRIEKSKIILKIGEEKIKIVPFVRSILNDTIIALVKNLKGYKKAKKIEILIKE